MNKDKIIKDLKERNDKLANQRRQFEIRLINEQYSVEKKDKEIERLNNIIKPKEVNYNYLKLLFEKKDKEEVIKSYVYKCEQLEKLHKSYEEKEIEVMKKDNIINEMEKYLKENYVIDNPIKFKNDLLDKLKELKGRDE